MRKLRTAASVLVVGVLVALTGAAPTVAAPLLAADLGISASQASGHIGESVDVRLVVRNNGPSTLLPGTWTLDLTAPPGTSIGGGSAVAGNCSGGDHHVQCRYGFTLRRGDRHELRLGLRIDGQPSGCGQAVVAYTGDQRMRNNAVNLRVTVGGQPRNCSGTQQSPTPKATRSPKPTATPEGAVTEAPPQDTQASAEALPAVPADSSSNGDGGGLSFASILVIVGGLALIALGGLLVWRLWKRADEDDDEEEPDEWQPAAPDPAYGGYPAQRGYGPAQAYDQTQPYGPGGYGPSQGGYGQGGYGNPDGGRPTRRWDRPDETGPHYR